MVSQLDYLPLHATLFECITHSSYPSEDVTLLPRIVSLLREARIDESMIESITKEEVNWGSRLSGGQKKIISIVAAILKEPDLLILDEVFNGLDKQSIKQMHAMILNHFPNAIILAIDHHGKDNNKLIDRQFYHHNLNFEKNQVTELAF